MSTPQPQPHTKIRAGEITLYGCPLADDEASIQKPDIIDCPFCGGPLEPGRTGPEEYQAGPVCST